MWPKEWRGPYPDWRDVWIGVYWDHERRGRMWHLDVYICLVPCLPVRLTWRGVS